MGAAINNAQGAKGDDRFVGDGRKNLYGFEGDD